MASDEHAGGVEAHVVGQQGGQPHEDGPGEAALPQPPAQALHLQRLQRPVHNPVGFSRARGGLCFFLDWKNKIFHVTMANTRNSISY